MKDSVSSGETTPVGMEKDQFELVEDTVIGADGFDTKSTNRLLRKIDFALIPFLSLLYLLSFLDRTNIGNARLAGLEASLHMKGLAYNNALAIFFPFYVLAEVPSNLMMKATRPSVWIPTIMVAWATVCIAMGLVKNYSGLMAARSFLGLAEGGLFPGVTFYITMWYKRHECGLRMSIFFSAATAAGAFGGLLARAIIEMDHTAGLRAWQWIFILEGIATFVVAIVAFFVMYDYPATAKFLSPSEKTEVSRRLTEDRGSLAEEFGMQYAMDALKDWKIWVNCLITIGIFTPLYSVSLFMPTIVKSLGYTDPKLAQLMTVPPYVVACVMCVATGFAADRLRTRGLFQMFWIIVSIAGFLMLLLSHDNKTKYAGTFFTAMGIYTNVPQCTCWNSNNVGGSTKRSVGMALQVGIGNLGGTMASYMFLSRTGPHFRQGYTASIALSAMSLTLSAFMTMYLRKENARRDREYKRPEDYTVEEKLLERHLGDNASFFRYTV
ncbi:high-affinity nicotinic acid transporter [Venturia nashicola]|nr:high-affinity nicotinic acid transporter [Venturia nashicola]